MWGGVTYLHRDTQGLHILRDGLPQTLPVDAVVLCAGQDADLGLVQALTVVNILFQMIDGAADPHKIEAKRIIDHGTRSGLTFPPPTRLSFILVQISRGAGNACGAAPQSGGSAKGRVKPGAALWPACILCNRFTTYS